jgi:hypothetical protein
MPENTPPSPSIRNSMIIFEATGLPRSRSLPFTVAFRTVGRPPNSTNVSSPSFTTTCFDCMSKPIPPPRPVPTFMSRTVFGPGATPSKRNSPEASVEAMLPPKSCPASPSITIRPDTGLPSASVTRPRTVPPIPRAIMSSSPAGTSTCGRTASATPVAEASTR